MQPVDFLILGIVAVLVGLAAYAIYRSKKAGSKCIGCPDSKTCSRNCAGCSGSCGKTGL